jgi:hypothetical protein
MKIREELQRSDTIVGFVSKEITSENFELAYSVCAGHTSTEIECFNAVNMVSIFVIVNLIQAQPDLFPELDDTTLQLAAGRSWLFKNLPKVVLGRIIKLVTC